MALYGLTPEPERSSSRTQMIPNMRIASFIHSSIAELSDLLISRLNSLEAMGLHICNYFQLSQHHACSCTGKKIKQVWQTSQPVNTDDECSGARDTCIFSVEFKLCQDEKLKEKDPTYLGILESRPSPSP